jgi:hypothetical protein
MIVEIIKPYFANGDHSLIAGACLNTFGEVTAPALRFVRVDTLRAPHCWMTASDFSHRVKIVSGYRYGDDALDADVKRRIQR